MLAALAALFVTLVLITPIPVSAHTVATPSADAAAATPPDTQPDTQPDTPVPAPTADDEQPPVPERPPVTASDFLPDDANLSDCIGLVERPGCGSEARGGSGQTAVFVVLVAALGVIFWRISAGVRRNRKAIDQRAREQEVDQRSREQATEHGAAVPDPDPGHQG